LDFEKPMFLDIETDIGGNAVWLIGVLWGDSFRQFYAATWEKERIILTEFLNFLSQNTPSVLVTYSCTSFDKRVLAASLQRHKLDEFHRFDNIAHIDLGSELARCFALPIKERKVKHVGELFGYQFKHRSLNGLQVANEYAKHLRERRPLDPTVLEYNEDDVRVLAHIVKRLSEFCKERPIGV